MLDGCTVQSKCQVLYNYKKNGFSIKMSDMVVLRFDMALPRLLFAQSSWSVSVGGTDISVLVGVSVLVLSQTVIGLILL